MLFLQRLWFSHTDASYKSNQWFLYLQAIDQNEKLTDRNEESMSRNEELTKKKKLTLKVRHALWLDEVLRETVLRKETLGLWDDTFPLNPLQTCADSDWLTFASVRPSKPCISAVRGYGTTNSHPFTRALTLTTNLPASHPIPYHGCSALGEFPFVNVVPLTRQWCNTDRRRHNDTRTVCWHCDARHDVSSKHVHSTLKCSSLMTKNIF